MEVFASRLMDKRRRPSLAREAPGQSSLRRIPTILLLQSTIGNQAVQRLLTDRRLKRDFLRGPNPRPAWSVASSSMDEARASVPEQPTVADKAIDDGEGDSPEELVMENGPEGGTDGGAGGVAAPAKKAGVDSFEVKWKKNAAAGPTVAKLRLDYKAKFKKDAAHDAALAEFRQNAMTKFEVTAGPHKGLKADTSPLHDDNYSRADDDEGRTRDEVRFSSNDNPGVKVALDKNDVIDYAFTAEQMIVDTSDSNKVIAKKGPHTGTITGKDPRTYGGVPITL